MGSIKLWEASEKSIENNINFKLGSLDNKVKDKIEAYIFPEKITVLPWSKELPKVFDEYFSKNEKTKHLFENKIPKTEVV